MSHVQFSLFFCALIVAYLLVHIRLRSFEVYLKEIARLRELNERLASVSDVLERVRLDNVEAHLGHLHEDLVEVQVGLKRVERAVGRVSVEAPPVAMAAPVPDQGPPQIQPVVEARLLALGYGRLHIITDLSDAAYEESQEIVVECTKDGMPFKGRVIIHNGAVQDVILQSVAQNFT